MEIQYFGANCIRLSTKKATIVVDDTLGEVGGKSVTKPGEIALFTGPHGQPQTAVKIAIDQPGEYEVSDISIQGIAAKAHIDESGKNATIYRIVADDIRIAIIGHVFPELSSSQLEALNTIDVLCIPTGGNGYTLDPVGALKLIKEIEPKIIIPTHYDDKGLSYPVPQQTLEDVIKGLSMEAVEPVAKLKVKAADIGETTQLVVLEKQ